ncbi:MAG: HD-GYP domain-containing protein [Acidimicrobiales bacterium]
MGGSDSHLKLLPALHSAEVAFHPGTARHCLRVGYLSAVLGEGLELHPDDVELLSWTGVLHDFGKLAIADDLVEKQSFVDGVDYEQLLRHPEAGADAVAALCPDIPAVVAGIRSHHERWDGSGFPRHQVGTSIPLFGRIVAVADVFDAMTHRMGPGFDVMGHEAAVRCVAAGSGNAFDPGLVSVFLDADARGLLTPAPGMLDPPSPPGRPPPLFPLLTG